MTKRQSLPVSALDVAAYILANHSRNTPILAWKMHKLVYFCQIQQMMREGVPLFNEKIIATHRGVMIKEFYPLHQSQWYIGDGSKGNLNHLSLKQTDVIAEVMKKYGDQTIEQLDVLIRQASPWKKARQAATDDRQEIVMEIILD